MKLSVTCLARTDMTPRAPKVAVAEARPVSAARVITERPEMRSRFDSLFEDDEELPTTLYTPTKSPRARRAVVAA